MSDCHPDDAPCDPDWKCRTHLGGGGAEVAEDFMTLGEALYMVRDAHGLTPVECDDIAARLAPWLAGYRKADPTAEVAASEALTLAQATELLHDDIAYWMANPFFGPKQRVEKVLWWMGQMREAGAREVVEQIEELCDAATFVTPTRQARENDGKPILTYQAVAVSDLLRAALTSGSPR